MTDPLIRELIELAIREDIGDGDHTSLACIPGDQSGKAQLLVKEDGYLAGMEVAAYVFNRLDPALIFHPILEDGVRIRQGDIAFTIEGPIHSILQAERLVLNLMQRMSGIATRTRKYVDQLNGLKTRILDTRKTTPGMRILDKMAVKIGKGENHRMGLHDMILIKDNHIDYAGGIGNALHRVLDYLESTAKKLKIEIEARSLEDVREILSLGGADRILLDNFSIEDTRAAVQLIGGKMETESSGGITLDNIRNYAECGIDFISVGALTHQIQSLDLSLKAIDT